MDKNIRYRIDYEHEDGGNVESCFCTDEIDREFAHELLDEFLDACEDDRVHKDQNKNFPHEFSMMPCGVH